MLLEYINLVITNNNINYGTFIGIILEELEKEVKFNNNYIIGEITIFEKDSGKEIRIINSYQEYCRNHTWMKIQEEYKNEEEIKECIMEINDKIIPFSYFHKFENIDKYKIKYIFNAVLKNYNYIFGNCSF